MRKLISTILFLITFSNISYSQNVKTLPDEFFIECDMEVIDLHLFYINQITLEVSMKIPDSKKFGISKNNVDELVFKTVGFSGGNKVFSPPEFRFNKWNGVLTKKLRPGGVEYRSSKCNILDKSRNPLYG